MHVELFGEIRLVIALNLVNHACTVCGRRVKYANVLPD